MKKSAIRKDFYMEIKKSYNRFLSIFLIVALGVAFFAGVRASKPDMRLSADLFYDDKNFMDIRVISTLGITDEDVEKIKEVEGVKEVMSSYSGDFVCGNKEKEFVVKTFSVPDVINRLTTKEGRLPESKDECFVDMKFLEDTGFKIGDKITLKSGNADDIEEQLNVTEFTISGAGTSPYYLSLDRGTSTVGNGDIGSFIVLDKAAYNSEVYTEVYVTTEEGIDYTCYTEKYDDYIDLVVKNIENIASVRCEVRYNEVIEEADSKLQDGKNKLADAKKEIDDKKAELEEGRTALEKGRTALEKGRRELKKASEEIEKKEKVILEAGEGKEELNKAKKTVEEKEKLLNENEKTLNEGEEKLKEVEKELALGEEELLIAKEKLAEGEKEYNDGKNKYLEEKEKADEKISEAEAEIANGEKEINDIKYPKWYVLDRNYIQTYVEYGQDSDRIGAIGDVFPLIFFLVAALVSLTTMTRMVEEERTQIGTLKALGYSKLSIAGKYLMYALLASVLGSVFGLIIGQKILPSVIINAYAILYNNLPEVVTPINLYYSITSTLAAVLSTTLAAVFACYKELAAVPAKLMRPAAPKSGKRVLMEKITFLWKHLNFTQKATVRNLFRYKKRFFMTVFGIGGCMSLLIVGYGVMDSIKAIGNIQFSEIRTYSSSIEFQEEADEKQKEAVMKSLKEDRRVQDAMYAYETSIDAGNKNTEKSCYLVISESTEELKKYISLHDRKTKKQYELDDEGVIITEKLAKLLDVMAGDEIYIKIGDTERTNVKIVAVVENYFMHYVYMSKEAYEKVFGKEVNFNEIFTNNIQDDIKFEDQFSHDYLEKEGIGSVSFINKSAERVDDMLKSMDTVIYVLVISAGLLAFIVLYNLNNININERKRELATIKVLGFYDNEVSKYVYRENILLTIIGIVLGLIMGTLLHRFIIVTVEIDMMMFGRNINLLSYIYSIVITAIFSVAVNFVMYFKLKKIDMIESLKSVE